MPISAAIELQDPDPDAASLRGAVLQGLRRGQKSIPPKFFYDAAGSRLFDAICKTPEYYPTRTECAILKRHAAEIADCAGPHSLLVEPGAGSCHKVRLLLEAMHPAVYMPVDICREHLAQAARAVAQDFPWLDVRAVCGDYVRLQLPADALELPSRVAFFPGSSIGNFEPHDAVAFLARLHRQLGPHGGVLIGVDLKKSPEILNRAYNDAAGYTAAFNLNLLARINRELAADFDMARFAHRAYYNAALGRIEMHLVATRAQRVCIEGEAFAFVPGETIHTENSYKYAIDEFRDVAQQAGFSGHRVWTDEANLFSVHYLSNQ